MGGKRSWTAVFSFDMSFHLRKVIFTSRTGGTGISGGGLWTVFKLIEGP